MVSRRWMYLRALFCLTVVLAGTTSAKAAFSTAPGYVSEQLYTTAGSFTICGGLFFDDDKLYFGQYTQIRSIDLSDNTPQTVGILPSNVDTPVVVRNNDTIYAAYGSSFNFPYPYHMGYIDANAAYIEQLEEDCIFDAAVNSKGDCYIVASPGAAGSKIFKYNWEDGGIIEIADIGGYQGGLAFDSRNNLYYADQGQGEMVGGQWVVIRPAAILMFTASQVESGGLAAEDGQAVFDITAGYIGFDPYDNFYATTGWGATLAKYDLDAQMQLEDVAYGGIGKFVINQNHLYAIDTDWSVYASTIQKIELPQPSPLELALQSIENAIENKNEALESINAALLEEQALTDALNNLIKSGEFEGLKRKDIIKAYSEVRLALICQRLAKNSLIRSIERMENTLEILTTQSEQ